MPRPRPAPIRPRTWLFLSLALAGFALIGLAIARFSAPDRVLIVASALEAQGRDLGPGMETLLGDCLEVLTGATVVHAETLPTRSALQVMAPDARLLRFGGRRDGTRLVLTLEWTTVKRLLADEPWIQDTAPSLPPRRALEQVLGQWPLPVRHHYLDQLVPQSPERFWTLLEGLSIRDDKAAVAYLPISQKLVEDEPGCATAWTSLGDHLYRSLWVDAAQAGIGLNSRNHRAFQQAVKLVPGHPRATFLWAMMLTDTGNQNSALPVLRDAIRLRPGTPDLYLGVAYAARTAGLLDLARKALDHRRRILGPMAAPSPWFAETTYLYLGDMETFSQDLARAADLRQDASIQFYRGYFALLKGNRAEALACMRAGSEPATGPIPFRDLCRAYRAYLEGRPTEGLKELREVDEIRGKLRIPDGEWTFKEAEAYALLGDVDRGIDCATRAFVQGFSCAAWYEGSPFLARVREHPRWPTLRRNIRERQAVLSGTFPASYFEF
jgi:tetratricopeptide (TPR) repeat protein